MQLPGGMVDGTHDLVTARTAGFTVLVFTSMFTCLTARSATASAFAHLLANRWLWAANAVSVLLQVAVVNLRFLNLAFGTAPMTLREWLLCAAMASAVLWFSELRKLADRAWGAPRSTRRVPA
jgi:Ca2+-transporting ATPase